MLSSEERADVSAEQVGGFLFFFQAVMCDIKWYSKWRTHSVLEAQWSAWRHGKEQMVSVEYFLLLDN